MNNCTFFILLLLPSIGLASFNFSYGANGRSYPSLGGEFETELGYSLPIYGTPGNDNPFFGLAKVSANAGTSFVVNRYGTNFTLYPISFIGLGFGKESYKSDYDKYTYYNCENIRCKGSLNKVYTQGKIAFAYKNLSTSFNYKYFNNEYNDEEGTGLPVAEYQYGLSVNPKEETQVQKSYFLGYKNNDVTYGLVSNNIEFLKSDKRYALNIFIYQFNLGVFSTILGAGTLTSSDVSPSGIVVFKITHQVLKDIALF